ncbi:hypothetical protein N7494_001706 [Penicillium frequentans]|uniref:Aflatoxin regulatory protein domain-containing protein n=1 Tax=Penicillium frequentans TaxID=3151616 RepID=A0AAD6GJ80_9EURO|nr:hypothetical protein N7494_001706 [Penicillium glabrum]
METDPFDMRPSKDWESLPTTLSGNIEYWGTALQYTAPAQPLHSHVESIAREDLFPDPSFDVDPNDEFNPGLYPSQSAITPSFQISTAAGSCMDFRLGSEHPENPMLDYFALPGYFSDNHNNQHQAFESLYNSDLCFENSLHTPILTPPPTATSTASCLAENRTPCIITATHYLRTLHTRQNNCLYQQISTGQEINEPEAPRMSGSVLKCNKEAGMSVCSMLQCACAFRPQNQLLIASICSQLVVWYRAMIRACFSRPGSGPSGQSVPGEPALPEKVIHEAVTIGDHLVDNPALGQNIQAQVILGELGHLQRLVDTLSVRIRQTGMDAGADSSSVGLPRIAHDRLVTHLSKEIQAVKNDLIMALR